MKSGSRFGSFRFAAGDCGGYDDLNALPTPSWSKQVQPPFFSIISVAAVFAFRGFHYVHTCKLGNEVCVRPTGGLAVGLQAGQDFH